MSPRGSFAVLLFVLAGAGMFACSSSSSSGDAADAGSDVASADAGGGVDAGSEGGTDAAAQSDGSKSTACTATFGSDLTAPYGRLDGTVLAILEPGNQSCPRPNSTHIVLEVAAKGSNYRMVVNVQSDFAGADPDVRFQSLHAPLPAPAWGEGWHADAVLDYVTTLNVHSTSGFTATKMTELAPKVADALTVGAKVSVYASTSGGDSAHLIHRNQTNQDGAIVIDPDGTSPTFLLFHFAEQTF